VVTDIVFSTGAGKNGLILSEQKLLNLNFQKVQEGIQILNIPK
jgi:hypothetical protein